MYWKQKISQKEIAKKFNINTVQVHRILNDAEKRGSVKVFVEGSFDICRQYEEALQKKYDLKHIEVVPTESTRNKETTADTLDPDPCLLLTLVPILFLTKYIQKNVEILVGLLALQMQGLLAYCLKSKRM